MQLLVISNVHPLVSFRLERLDEAGDLVEQFPRDDHPVAALTAAVVDDEGAQFLGRVEAVGDLIHRQNPFVEYRIVGVEPSHQQQRSLSHVDGLQIRKSNWL